MGNTPSEFETQCTKEPLFSKGFQSLQHVLQTEEVDQTTLIDMIVNLDHSSLKQAVRAILLYKNIDLPSQFNDQRSTLCRYIVEDLLRQFTFLEIHEALMTIPGCRNTLSPITLERLHPSAVKARLRIGSDGRGDCLSKEDVDYLHTAKRYFDNSKMTREEKFEIFKAKVSGLEDVTVETSTELTSVLQRLPRKDCDIWRLVVDLDAHSFEALSQALLQNHSVISIWIDNVSNPILVQLVDLFRGNHTISDVTLSHVEPDIFGAKCLSIILSEGNIQKFALHHAKMSREIWSIVAEPLNRIDLEVLDLEDSKVPFLPRYNYIRNLTIYQSSVEEIVDLLTYGAQNLERLTVLGHYWPDKIEKVKEAVLKHERRMHHKIDLDMTGGWSSW